MVSRETSINSLSHEHVPAQLASKSGDLDFSVAAVSHCSFNKSMIMDPDQGQTEETSTNPPVKDDTSRCHVV